MKANQIIAEGLCGMQVNFNLQDMHVAAQFVNTINTFFAAKEAHEKWYNGYYDKSIRYKQDPETGENICQWDTWSKYREFYPEPEQPTVDMEGMLRDAAKFFKKIASKPETEATIFSDDDEA